MSDSDRIHRVSSTPMESINALWAVYNRAVELGEQDAADGRGESDHENNGGPWVVSQRAADGTGGEVDTGNPFCASWASAKIMLALADIRELLQRPDLVLGYRTSRSAKYLTDRAAAFGKKVRPEAAQRGMIGLKKRDGGHHTFLIRGPLGKNGIPTVEANVGRYPALVKCMYRQPGELLYLAQPWV